MPKVRLRPQDVVVEVDMGAPLIEALLLAVEARPDILHDLDLWHDCECHGFVEVLEGNRNLRSLQSRELDAIASRGIPLLSPAIRHPCQTLVLGDVTVSLLKRDPSRFVGCL